MRCSLTKKIEDITGQQMGVLVGGVYYLTVCGG
jgi:hypothetical protein